MRSRRFALLMVSGIAVLALAVGLLVGYRLESPADAAARTKPPKPSRITVPVERRALESSVITRAEASYRGSKKLTVQTEGPGVVTGQVPKSGSKLDEGDVLLEVTGRPVLALGGELPPYRQLEPGSTGPDVKQLEQALGRLDLGPGEIDETYTADTAAAVERLYEKAGYDAPEPSADKKQQLRAARAAVQDAEDAVEDAEDAYAGAEQALADAEQAERAAEEAAEQEAEQEAEREESEDPAVEQVDAEAAQGGSDVDGAQQALATAEDELANAQDQLDKANEDLQDAEYEAGTPLPTSEVVFVENLPRRLSSVEVDRGSTVKGEVGTVSGTTLTVNATVDTRTKQQLETGMSGQIDIGTGDPVQAKITAIERDEADSWNVRLEPGELSESEHELLRDSNVRVTIPVGSTRGKVLVVPVAALSTGAGGESRVEVMRDGEPELVRVRVGLSADGHAEVRPIDGRLDQGDRVVVGR